MKKNFKEMCIYIIIIGVIAYTINLFFGNATISFIEQVSYNGTTMYKLNAYTYLNNLQTSMEQTTYLQLTVQTRSWINITSNILQEQFWADLGNNMAVILNWIIFGLNIIIYPFRIGGFVLKQGLVFMGINIDATQQHGLTWLVNLVNFLVKIMIPYV